jgi:two-component system KDP operon response regulator KdpE
MLARAFHDEGLVPSLAFTRHQILGCLSSNSYRLLVAHESLADWKLVRSLREQGSRSIAVLTFGKEPDYFSVQSATGSDVSFADDSNVPELVQRGQSLIALTAPANLPNLVTWGPLELHVKARQARWSGRPLLLTPLQFRIMEVLARAAGAAVSADLLSSRIWGDHAFKDQHRLIAHIRRIRKKIESDPTRPVHLVSVRGEGYRLALPEVEMLIDLRVVEPQRLQPERRQRVAEMSS